MRVKFENPGLGYMLESIMAFQKEDSSFFGPSLCSISILSLIKHMFPLSKNSVMDALILSGEATLG